MKNAPRHRRSTVLASLLAVLIVGMMCDNARSADSSTNTISFSFNDQYTEPMVLKPEFPKPMIVTVADKDGSDQLIEWIEPLTKEFGKTVSFFPIADLRAVPGLLKGMVRRSFKKRFEYDIAMDWDGVAVKQLSTKAGHANLILLNRQGKIVTSVHGPVSEENLSTMVKAIRTELTRESMVKTTNLNQ